MFLLYRARERVIMSSFTNVTCMNLFLSTGITQFRHTILRYCHLEWCSLTVFFLLVDPIHEYSYSSANGWPDMNHSVLSWWYQTQIMATHIITRFRQRYRRWSIICRSWSPPPTRLAKNVSRWQTTLSRTSPLIITIRRKRTNSVIGRVGKKVRK
jgi:hypothetical protein